MTRVAVIIPAYNEATVIRKVLNQYQSAIKTLSKNIRVKLIVIDDGSSDETAKNARLTGVRVIRHLLNLGLGGAISTGLKIARDEEFDGAVTADADGQHDPHDLIRLISKLAKKQADFIVGSRWLEENKDVPLHRQIGNKYIMNSLTLLFSGMITTDSQSGLRGFSRRAIEKIRLHPQRMEVSTELFAQARQHHLRYQELPIKAIYTDYSIAKGQRSLNGLAIIWRLAISRLM